MTKKINRVFLVVLDSVGIGGASDARDFGDDNPNTLKTIAVSEKFNTPVLVWKISAQDEKNLDKYEGFPRFYRKKNLRVYVKSLDGEDLGELTAMVYIMTSRAVNSRFANPLPSDYYYSILDKGYETFGFDTNILEDALLEVCEHFNFDFGS